jgi:hypothetical protein
MLESFFAPTWGSEVEQQVRLRIKLSVYAYAYEFDNTSLVSDGEFDEMSKQVNLQVKTGNRKIDNFFSKHFQPDTGMWIHSHPEKKKIKQIYETYYKSA